MRGYFPNSLSVAGMTVLFASVLAVPLAYLTVRFQFRGAAIIHTLGVLPLIMPAFVGAAAMQLLCGRSGSLNLVLNDAFGSTVPLMVGLDVPRWSVPTFADASVLGGLALLVAHLSFMATEIANLVPVLRS